MSSKLHVGLIGSLCGVLFVSLFSCSKVDNTLGNTLIPEDQKMKIAMDTVYGINAYLGRVDSFPINSSRYAWYYGTIGAKSDPTYGALESGWIGQYGGVSFLSSSEDDDDRYGIDPVADSLYITLSFETSLASGDTAVSQTFNVYELTHRFQLDSLYWMGMNMSGKYDPEPLFTFECTGGTSAVSKRITGTKAEKLMAHLMKATTAMYESDSLFVDEYKGLYVKPADNSSRKASLMQVTLTNSSMSLYAHNFKDETRKEVDTIRAVYSFNPVTYTNLMSLNTYKRDYTHSAIDMSKVNDTASTATPVSIGYIQGCGGVTTYLRFTKEFVESLKSNVVAPFKFMAINSARLDIGVYEPTNAVLTDATNRLGCYIDYTYFEPTSDYLYTAESSSYNPVTLPYGGYLIRTHNCYSMDISRIVQTMADLKAQSYIINVGPSVYEAYNQREVRLNTSKDPSNPVPLRVVVTYTLMQ